jgi:copper transport protein
MAAASGGVDVALTLARAGRYVATALVIGLLLAALLHRAVAEAPADRPDASRWLRAAAILGAAASLGVVPLLSAHGSDPRASLGDVVGSARGAWAIVAAAAFALLALLPRHRWWQGGRPAPAVLGALAAAVVALPLGGHAADGSPALVLVVAEIVHVVAMGAWAGGLAGLLLLRRGAGADDRRLAAALARFSPLALWCVVALTAAGTFLAVLQLTTLYDLTDTGYGRAIAIKAFLLLGIVGIVVLQRELLLPRLREADADAAPSAARDVRRALRGEVGLLLAVLVVTGALATSTPPRAAAPEPVRLAAEGGPPGGPGWRVRVRIDPARRGANAIALRITDRAGRPLAAAVRIRALPPNRGAAIGVPLTASGDGLLRAPAVRLDSRGRWRLELRAPRTAAGPIARELAFRVR